MSNTITTSTSSGPTPEILAGIEIGTSKVCAVVAEYIADGTMNVIGVGQFPSHGVRKGEIIDPLAFT